MASRAWRSRLLDQCIDIASSPEGRSHARIRTQLQRDVCVTAIDLGLIDTALRYADRIDDWRRGEVMALAAQALAAAGDRVRANECILEAVKVAGSTEDSRWERLNTEIAVAFARLGEVEQARRFAARLPQQWTGRVEAELTPRVTGEELDLQFDAFDRAISTGSFEIVQSGIQGYLAAWPRVHGDATRAARAERAIRDALHVMPVDVQIGMRLRIAANLDSLGRREESLKEIAAAAASLQSSRFVPEVDGPLARDVARAWLKAGDRDAARALLLEMLARYERDPAAIVDIDRADYLRPIAEALVETGNPSDALRVWQLAIDAGAINPNARPRAEDLCRTCLSMVRADVEPPAAMQSRISDIRSGLKAPW